MIDVHTHLFPDALFRAIWAWFEKYGWRVRYQVMADEVVRLLKEEQGIERFVVLNYAHKPGMSESLNTWTYQFCKKYPEAIPFGTVHPEDDVKRLLDQCFRDYHFYGIKFHSHVAAIRPDDERLFPIYEKVMEYNRVITLHAGTGPSLHGYHEKTDHISGAQFVRPLLKRYPDLKIIIPHLGAEEFDAFFDLMSEFPNLWMDTTMALSGYFPFKIPWENVEKFSDRILYGSDFPNLPYPAKTEINNIRASNLSLQTQEKIFSCNAKRLFGL